MIIRKRDDIKTLTDIRTIIALHWYKLKIPGRIENKTRIFSSDLSWQERIQWVKNMVEYDGKKGENIEWLSIIYNSKTIAIEKLKSKSNRVSGANNPGYKHQGKLSPFSKKSKFYDPTLSKRVNDKLSESGNRNMDIRYYLNKGYTEEYSKKLLSKRQSTFSLEKCIDKYGEEDGKRVWKERQDKWQDTLNSKPEKEKARINSLKCGHGFTVSKAERELIKMLSESYPDIETSYSIFYDEGSKYYIYDIKVGDKIIEYNGDFWHANPKIYDETFYNRVSKKSAKDIWEKEVHKDKIANDNGFDVLKIWESEYKSDKQECIDRCVNFLNK